MLSFAHLKLLNGFFEFYCFIVIDDIYVVSCLNGPLESILYKPTVCEKTASLLLLSGVRSVNFVLYTSLENIKREMHLLNLYTAFFNLFEGFSQCQN